MPTYGVVFSFFFFNDTATTEIFTLSLHDALPIYLLVDLDLLASYVLLNDLGVLHDLFTYADLLFDHRALLEDRKSTRLNSSHANISYAVFCLKKKTLKIRRILMLA